MTAFQIATIFAASFYKPRFLLNGARSLRFVPTSHIAARCHKTQSPSTVLEGYESHQLPGRDRPFPEISHTTNAYPPEP